MSAADPTALESLTAAVRAGTATEAVLATAMLDATLYLSGSREVAGADDELLPMTFEVDGAWFISCFTRIEHAEQFAATAPFVVPMPGRRIFDATPAGVGVLLNPGTPELSAEIHPATLLGL